MKGVIMAGGKGTRLRPLTCNMPKPMVPMLHKPVMEYGIELLKRYGITDIAVTVHYLPDAIKNYFGDGRDFGVNLHYFEEDSPLGTAGSIKNAEDFLDERFIVISGDALTDFDLEKGIDFHEEKGSLVTILMKQVESPLEYGVIMTNQDGKIIRFLEKPSWNEVFSDTVNTGIYVLEPEIFQYIEKDVPVDFSKDLFPLLMKENKKLFGYQAEGYWSDIGSLQQYRQSHYDMLNGLVNLPFAGKEQEPGIWIGENVVIEEGSMIEGPVSIADGAVIRKGAHVGKLSVVGKNSVVSSGSSLKKTVLWNDVFVGDQCELRGATIANGTKVEKDASVFEHAVIGNHCTIGKSATIKPDVKIWPEKEIFEEALVHTSIVWGKKATKSLFGSRGVSGIANVEITPDYIARLASAYGAVLPYGSQILIASDSHDFSVMIKQSFIQGLHSSGVHTLDISPTVAPVVRFSIEDERLQGGVYVRFSNPTGEKQLMIDFYDNKGLPIHTDLERKIENAYWQEDYRRASFDRIGKGAIQVNKHEDYTSALLEGIQEIQIQEAKFRVVVNYNHQPYLNFIPNLYNRLNCEILTAPYQTKPEEMASFVRVTNANIGVLIGESGETLRLITETGEVLDEETMLALYVFTAFSQGKHKEMAIPVYGSSALDSIAERLKGKLIRTKANPRSIMEVGEGVLNYQYDAQYAFVHILEMMAMQQITLSELVKMLPDVHMLREYVPCPKDKKGRVMRRLMEDIRDNNVELLDGIKVFHPEGGWTLILPDVEQPVFTVYSQNTNPEQAKQAASQYIEKIQRYQQV
ncbi:sugar phosphate nucleotidyltransferase [Fictibacillus phosphorivorans]|uniref:sugar phosphate nucleotidyltransferase n=1 Tax=Fictibacillus phosphorivorans TaxID=1221500 RepID=UPI00203E3F59|nr:sugar phosphate nucleotidyltransferase [Fictibacillus phosphorivorans]MCM3716816.1 sugar phosphate nucleotidyltransferase [Fictibacillus phosphorivorans]MCM3774635.1 sugar phosphate nucleotidyltransferase [Fictibacillus phosphorivorans]